MSKEPKVSLIFMNFAQNANKYQKLLIYILVFIILIINGCAPAYVPNVINTPLLSNKGEIQTSIHTGIAGFDPQFAYAITDHIGFMSICIYVQKTIQTLLKNVL